MKKILLILSVIAVAGLNSLSAQTYNFETWTGTEPNGWESSNAQTTQSSGAQTVFKETTTPGQGNISVKMRTGSCPECPNFSILGQWGPVTPLPNPLGGSISLEAPYSQRPISVDFKYKSQPMGNDAGGLSVTLTRYNSGNGETETIGEGYFEAGTQITNWTNMNMPIIYYSSLIPDTIEFWATSSIGSLPDLTPLGMPPIPFSPPIPVAGSEFYIDAVNINIPSCAGFSVSVSGTNETSVGAMDGTATVTSNGGTSPYTYSWSNLVATSSISGLTSGLYSVTVIDGNGCAKVGNYNVLPFSCGAFSVAVTGTNATSFTAEDGTASATITGIAGPYTYQWNNGETTSSISGLRLGTYAVAVTAANGNCIAWGYFPNTSPTGIDNIQPVVNSIIVYPNPSDGKFKFTSKNNNINSIEIFNTLGENIYSVTNSKHQNENEINISNNPKGIYFVKIYDGEKIQTKKIIIQ